MDNSAKGRFDIILGRDILKIEINLKLPEHVIEYYHWPLKVSTTPMVDFGVYVFKDLNTEKITSEESFNNANVEEVYKSEHLNTPTKLLRIIYSKYEKSV